MRVNTYVLWHLNCIRMLIVLNATNADCIRMFVFTLEILFLVHIWVYLKFYGELFVVKLFY